MRVTLFGTRGSLAVPGPEMARYGGNTSTVEVRGSDGTILVLDAGTGIRPLGVQIPIDAARVDILLTHLHMDHIQGLGFFDPLYHPGTDVHIWSFVCHPNPTVGYRIQGDEGTVVYLPDHEPALGLRDGRWLEPEWTSGYDLAEGADLLIHDAQYTDEQYARCTGWGHSTIRKAIEFASHVGAKKLVLFHHDPSHDDKTLDRLIADAMERLKPRFLASGGCEGAVFEVGS